MVDVALLFQPRGAALTHAPLARAGVAPGDYVLVTAHRAGNVDDPARLRRLVDLLLALPVTAVLPLHPRTRARLEAAGLARRARARAPRSGCCRRSATSSSPPCSATPGPSSPTRAACRRRRTWPASRA